MTDDDQSNGRDLQSSARSPYPEPLSSLTPDASDAEDLERGSSVDFDVAKFQIDCSVSNHTCPR